MHAGLCYVVTVYWRQSFNKQAHFRLIVSRSVWPWLNRCGGSNLGGPVPGFSPLPSALALTLPLCSPLTPRVTMQGEPPLQGWRERGRCAHEKLVSGGGEPALELVRSCSCSLEVQTAANLSSLDRHCVWQFQCFSRFDAPICLRGGEKVWRESNWASVRGG